MNEDYSASAPNSRPDRASGDRGTALEIPRFLRHERNTDCLDGERERALTLEGIKAVLTGADNIDAMTTAEQRIERALAIIEAELRVLT